MSGSSAERPLNDVQLELLRCDPDVPKAWLCAKCGEVAVDSFKLPCCDKPICATCVPKVSNACPNCFHSPLDADGCTPNKAVRRSIRAYVMGKEKKARKAVATKNDSEATAANTPSAEPPSGSGSGNVPSQNIEKPATGEETAGPTATEAGNDGATAAQSGEASGQPADQGWGPNNESPSSHTASGAGATPTATEGRRTPLKPLPHIKDSDAWDSPVVEEEYIREMLAGNAISPFLQMAVTKRMRFPAVRKRIKDELAVLDEPQEPEEPEEPQPYQMPGMPFMMGAPMMQSMMMNMMASGMFPTFGQGMAGTMGMNNTMNAGMNMHMGGNNWNGQTGAEGYGTGANGGSPMVGFNQAGGNFPQMNQYPRNNLQRQNHVPGHGNFAQQRTFHNGPHNGSHGYPKHIHGFGPQQRYSAGSRADSQGIDASRAAQAHSGRPSQPLSIESGQAARDTDARGTEDRTEPQPQRAEDGSSDLTPMDTGKTAGPSNVAKDSVAIAAASTQANEKISELTGRTDSSTMGESPPEAQGLQRIQTIDVLDSIEEPNIAAQDPADQYGQQPFADGGSNYAGSDYHGHSYGHGYGTNFGNRASESAAYGSATVLTPGEPVGVGVKGAPTGPRAMREGRANVGFGRGHGRFNPPPRFAPSVASSTRESAHADRSRRSPERDDDLRSRPKSPSRSPARSVAASKQEEDRGENYSRRDHGERDRSRSTNRRRKDEDHPTRSVSPEDHARHEEKSRRHHRSSKYDDYEDGRRDDDYPDERYDDAQRAKEEDRSISRHRSRRDKDDESYRSSRHRERSREHRRRHKDRSRSRSPPRGSRYEDKKHDADDADQDQAYSDRKSRNDKYRDRERASRRDRDYYDRKYGRADDDDYDRDERKYKRDYDADRDDSKYERDYDGDRVRSKDKDRDYDRKRSSRRHESSRHDDYEEEHRHHRSSRRYDQEDKYDREEESKTSSRRHRHDREDEIEDHNAGRRADVHDDTISVLSECVNESAPLNAPKGPSAHRPKLEGIDIKDTMFTPTGPKVEEFSIKGRGRPTQSMGPPSAPARASQNGSGFNPPSGPSSSRPRDLLSSLQRGRVFGDSIAGRKRSRDETEPTTEEPSVRSALDAPAAATLTPPTGPTGSRAKRNRVSEAGADLGGMIARAMRGREDAKARGRGKFKYEGDEREDGELERKREEHRWGRKRE